MSVQTTMDINTINSSHVEMVVSMSRKDK